MRILPALDHYIGIRTKERAGIENAYGWLLQEHGSDVCLDPICNNKNAQQPGS